MFKHPRHVSSCPNRWATAPELSSSCRCIMRASFPPQMRAFNQTRVKSPPSAARSNKMLFLTLSGKAWSRFKGTRWCDRTSCRHSGGQSAGGGDHAAKRAPSSAAEAQREASRETGLFRGFLRPHRTAAQVSSVRRMRGF